MKIAVIGASGMIGSEIVLEALRRNHIVSSYSRSGTEVHGQAGMKLNFLNSEEVINVIDNHDYTVISVAGRDDYVAVLKAHKDLIAARPQGEFLVVGGAGALNISGQKLVDMADFPEEYKEEARTFASVYDAYLESEGLNWRMIAPSPEIMPGVRTGEYRVEKDQPAGSFISTQDFAVAVIDELENSLHTKQRFTVASVDEQKARG